MAITTHIVVIIAKGFQLNSFNFLILSPDFIIMNASKKNFIPWLISVARQNMKIFIAKAPDEIENRPKGMGVKEAKTNIQKPRLAYKICI